jgi:hypothetical protein
MRCRKAACHEDPDSATTGRSRRLRNSGSWGGANDRILAGNPNRTLTRPGQKPPSVKDSFPAFHPAPLTVAAAWQ